MKHEARICVCILAAGKSRRMGVCKLLQPFAGSSLLKRSIDTAISSDTQEVIVITGAYQSEMEATIQQAGALAVYNPFWNEGQSASVKSAVKHAIDNEYDSILIMVADQPFVRTMHLNALLDAYRNGNAQVYLTGTKKRRGNPCVFDKSVFPQLLELSGDEGARSLFRMEVDISKETVCFDDPNLFEDVDTAADMSRLEHLFERKFSALQMVVPLCSENGGHPLKNKKVISRSFPLIDKAFESDMSFSYLDAAATSQIESSVLDAMNEFDTNKRANVHRGIYQLAETATEAYEESRKTVASFFGGAFENIVFTSGATAALNLAILGWGRNNLNPDDLVIVDTGNHHSNIIPWHMLAQEKGIRLAFTGIDDFGRMDETRWGELLSQGPKAVALAHMSNVTGFTCDAARLIRQAHDAGSVVILDCAQSAGHMPLDCKALDVDFAAASAHKMHGPFGIGALWGKPELLETMQFVAGGGGMVKVASETGFAAVSSPQCFEAGTPNISGAIGFAAACDFIDSVGTRIIQSHTQALVDQAIEAFSQLERVRIVGGNAQGLRSTLFSFVVESVHPHDVADFLGQKGICVRAGTHCAQPIHKALGIPATVRASFSLHSDCGEAEALVEAVKQVSECV